MDDKMDQFLIHRTFSIGRMQNKRYVLAISRTPPTLKQCQQPPSSLFIARLTFLWLQHVLHNDSDTNPGINSNRWISSIEQIATLSKRIVEWRSVCSMLFVKQVFHVWFILRFGSWVNCFHSC